MKKEYILEEDKLPFDKINEWNIEDLNKLIYNSLFDYSIEMQPTSENEKNNVSKRWIIMTIESLRHILCERKFLENIFIQNSEERNLLIAVFDSIISLKILAPIPVFLISFYIVKKGLKSVCPTSDESAQANESDR